ncbi:magnesium transport protein CorA [Paenibacillus chitinolyticus]|uniref:magnesium transporter CorA family protein n=1 Tax=Paenibacillus chitinolyticus TaxID=79263 RepID=UPI0026E50003|nr:magnesium transporter CorA family protein [Paenibacillus chitinolyticus]GKS13869.1 magnesium transport protein CorA [Paenibacillus chitinolyticus]
MEDKELESSSNWVWHDLHDKEEDLNVAVDALPEELKPLVKQAAAEPFEARLYRNKGSELLEGAFYYDFDSKCREGTPIFHFLVNEHHLVTINFKEELLSPFDPDLIREQALNAKNALEGLFVILGYIAERLLHVLTDYEKKMRQVGEHMRKRNNSKLLDRILDRRHELLDLTKWVRPLKDTMMTTKELFVENMEEGLEHRRMCIKIERIMTRLKLYTEEVEALLALDTSIANYRGNEITKTLTVFTAVFAPPTMLAGIWGMNFENMPELKWTAGYYLALGLIVALPIVVLGWLHWKGWTGDIIKGKNKNSNLK